MLKLKARKIAVFPPAGNHQFLKPGVSESNIGKCSVIQSERIVHPEPFLKSDSLPIQVFLTILKSKIFQLRKPNKTSVESFLKRYLNVHDPAELPKNLSLSTVLLNENFNSKFLPVSPVRLTNYKFKNKYFHPNRDFEISARRFFRGVPVAISEENEERSSGEWGETEAASLILHVKDEFESTIQKYDSILVLFYTNWCKNCTRFKRAYALSALIMSKEGIPGTLAACDLTTNQELAESQGVVGIPTLKYFRKGVFIRQYTGRRSPEEIVMFMKDPPISPMSTEGFQLQ